VTDNKTFEVDDITKVYLGSDVYVHSQDFTRDSFGENIEIDAINGNEITLNKDLGFTPQIGDLVDGSRFQDGGNPYLII
jgi:DNA polymerase II small subunit/DNA polymerase delta subunit B